ncbi:MAG: type II secretion system protein GspM [Gallionella sp.]|nr:type II secretion system protein M [Gallionella sp.]
MNLLRHGFAKFWSARDARERKVLVLAVIVVALALIYTALIAPALTGREQLRKKLPVLREQVVLMQALSKEVVSYGEQTSPVIEPLSKSSVESALTRQGLKAQSVTTTGDFVQIQLNDVAFSSTLSWLDDLQKNARATVSETTITALAQPDKVDAKITLQQQRNP